MVEFITGGIIYTALLWGATVFLWRHTNPTSLFWFVRVGIFALPLAFLMPGFDFVIESGREETVTTVVKQIEKPVPETIAPILESPVTGVQKSDSNHLPNQVALPFILSMLYFAGVVMLLVKLKGNLAVITDLKKASKRAFKFRGIPILVHQSNLSPMSIGYIKPVILLPQRLLDSMEKPALDAVLYHERVHIRRGDLFVILYLNALGIVFFFSPFYYLLKTMVIRVMEQSCDEQVLAKEDMSPKFYGRVLLQCQMQMSTISNPLPATQNLRKSELRLRLESFKYQKIVNWRYLSLISSILILVVACVNPGRNTMDEDKPNGNIKSHKGIEFWDDEVYHEFFKRHRTRF